MDHGIDFLGNEVQPEELNRIEQGKQYGWPHVYGYGGINPQSTPPGGITKQQWKAMSTPMVIGYTAHAAPMQMRFYTGGSFPADYAGDAFVTMRGSWNNNPASGYEIARIHFENGQPKSFEPFVSGFLTDGGKTHFARPVGLAIANDGSLLMADDANGVLYRISYTGKSKTRQPTSAPAAAMQAAATTGVGVPLALEREETQSQGSLQVASPTIEPMGAISLKHSDYADGVSPPLTWTAMPHALSYAIIMEDPDAKPITPFVHWVAWNIPGTLTQLPEGLQEQQRLMEQNRHSEIRCYPTKTTATLCVLDGCEVQSVQPRRPRVAMQRVAPARIQWSALGRNAEDQAGGNLRSTWPPSSTTSFGDVFGIIYGITHDDS